MWSSQDEDLNRVTTVKEIQDCKTVIKCDMISDPTLILFEKKNSKHEPGGKQVGWWCSGWKVKRRSLRDKTEA